MTGVCNSLHDIDIAEAISMGNVVLEELPPDCVQTISQYFEDSMPQTRHDTTCNDSSESDSGESLFITQKPTPEPVRTRKMDRSNPTPPKDLDKSEATYLVSDSQKKPTRSKKKLPKYTFPFVEKKQWMGRRSIFTVRQNISLHNATMGGFFKCVRELWEDYRGVYVDVSLPTVYMDRDSISPLSEETEEERSEEEDIKVVKSNFLAASKPKCAQPWYTPGKTDDHVNQQSRKRRASNTSRDVSQGQKKTTKKVSTSRCATMATLLLSDTDSLDDGRPCREQPQRKTGNNHDLHRTSVRGQTETPNTKRRSSRGKKKMLFRKNNREEELCSDSDATVCDPLQLQGSPREDAQRGKEAITSVTEAQADVFQMDDLSQTHQQQQEEETESQSLLQSLPQFVADTKNDSVCGESTPKKKKKKKKKAKGDYVSVEEGRGESQEEPEGLHSAASATAEAGETFCLPDENGPKPPAMQTCDNLKNSAHDDDIAKQEKRDLPDSPQKKRKRKKRMLTAENIREEVRRSLVSGVRVEDSEASVMYNIENGEQEKKRKEQKGVEDGENVEQLQSPEAAATGKWKCGLENMEFYVETLGASYKKKNRKHISKKQSSILDDAQVDDAKVSSSNDGVTLEEHEVKKKKKRESMSEGVSISYASDKSEKLDYIDSQTTEDAEQLPKKKKKKKRKEKMDELSNSQTSEDTVAQSDGPVSVRKKEKKRHSSFLYADSVEKDDPLHQQQNFSSKSVAAVVCDETELAETTGNCGDGVSKKKKKKRRRTSATLDNADWF